jgi:hypothetical protein
MNNLSTVTSAIIGVFIGIVFIVGFSFFVGEKNEDHKAEVIVEELSEYQMENFGKTILKEMFNIGRKPNLSNDEGYLFVKKHTSPEVSKRLYLDTEVFRKNAAKDYGQYRPALKHYQLSFKDGEYIMDIWLDLQFLNGNEKTVTSSKYLVTLEMAGYSLTNYGIHEFGSSEYQDKEKEF